MAMSSVATRPGASHVLAAFIGSGLVFMLVPGTFLGVWNLMQISGRESVALVSPAWIQAHGHAQIFGWIGSFILGIGFYSLPRSGAADRNVRRAWIVWALWTGGVWLRWLSSVYAWEWRTLVPLSAAAELAAFAIFARAVSAHRPTGEATTFAPAVRVVISATVGLALTLVANVAMAAWIAWTGESPALPHGIDQRYLTLATWGFLAPFVWGFSTRWLPALLGLKQTRVKALFAGVIVNAVGVIVALAGFLGISTMCFVVSAVLVVIALRLFERRVQAPKVRGIHRSFPMFVTMAYGWLLVASLVGVAAAVWDVSGGMWGASRHAFTVGFVSVMVFSIGQRVLPAFIGAPRLWSPRLMLIGLASLSLGCLLRVSSEILAYQDYATWAWRILPVSAVIEMIAVSCFAVNMFATLGLDTGFTPLARGDSADGRRSRVLDVTAK
jgi:hypothetical protein